MVRATLKIVTFYQYAEIARNRYFLYPLYLSIIFQPGLLFWGFTSLWWYFSQIVTWKQEKTNHWDRSGEIGNWIPGLLLCKQELDHYWRAPNYRKEFTVFRLFCNQNKEKYRKKYSMIQGQLKFYQTVYFLSRNSKYKSRKSGGLWPLLFVYFPLTSHHIIGSSVSMSVKYKLWHWYGTLLSDIPII